MTIPNAPNPNSHPIMQTLRAARIAANMSQAEVAEALGYTKSEISHMETGARNLYLQRVIDYADLFEFDLKLVSRNHDNG